MTHATGDVLIRIEGTLRAAAAHGETIAVTAAGTQFVLRPLFEVPDEEAADGRASGPTVWHLARPLGAADVVRSPWDVARDVARGAAAAGMRVTDVEPDFFQDRPAPSKSGGESVVPRVSAWPPGDDPSRPAVAGRHAREHASPIVRVAYLETGDGLDRALFCPTTFEPSSSEDRAADVAVATAFGVRIVGVRVDAMVRTKTSSMARAVAHVAGLCDDERTRVHVLWTGTGGVASKAWAEAVDLAYLRGVVLVTAAGNDVPAAGAGGPPTKPTVDPTRFERVLSASGTDAAAVTPRIVEVAALYLRTWGGVVFDRAAYPELWMRVEVVRRALLDATRTDGPGGDPKHDTPADALALDALKRSPVPKGQLTRAPRAGASFAFRHALVGPGDTGGPAAAASVADGPGINAAPLAFCPDRPKFRELRGYALDPGFAVSLQTRTVSETVYRVPWDETLGPGPRDAYLDVIDVDPASRLAYEPVDLRHPHLLATQGLPPSEGTPQFHQQMAYAVARMTIENFEKALGRPSLWRPGPPPPGGDPHDDSTFVPRLRVYPHALRAANAYYSPAKIALLFGYFSTGGPDEQPEQVFTCLSQDVVAHETTHALLDGMHRKYLSDSNPDVLAFHEAFADVVALLQRLTLPDLLRHQIALTRGRIRTQRSLLGELATQFGRAVGERGGLRDAIGAFDAAGQWHAVEPTGREYDLFTEPHARGSVLVAAVFDALVSIYEQRTEDLVRIASEGSGVLRPGAIHPDLVARLAEQATKSASHVLRMCIRALDYCPPTDITFGEYLRAVVTADHEIVPDDDLGYRVAFVEAFRRRGIRAGGVRTLSVENLLWRRQELEPRPLSSALDDSLRDVRDEADAQAFTRDRGRIFDTQRRVRRGLHERLRRHFAASDAGPSDAAILGIDPAKPFEVHSARFAMRTGPDGQLLSQAIVGLLQRDKQNTVDGVPFEGGSTVIADLASRQVRYIIRKNVLSGPRRRQQADYAAAAAARGHGPAYWAARPDEPFAALHAAAGEG